MTLKITEHCWPFVCQWYNPEQIHRSINKKASWLDGGVTVPEDVYSMEFAEWLADQYRLAMAKGASLAMEEIRMELSKTVTPG